MNNQQAYNTWAVNYDAVVNKTRDLEGIVLRKVLSEINFSKALEVGCGTGKNTLWLSERADKITSVDFSEEMLQKAKEKINSSNIEFIQADITQDWNFAPQEFELVTCSLILEHIEDINFIFKQARIALIRDGYFYVCELHPFKQYQGSKARFDNLDETIVLDCFLHNVSEYFKCGKKNNFECIDLKEWFDDDETNVPRLISFLFRKISD